MDYVPMDLYYFRAEVEIDGEEQSWLISAANEDQAKEIAISEGAEEILDIYQDEIDRII